MRWIFEDPAMHWEHYPDRVDHQAAEGKRMSGTKDGNQYELIFYAGIQGIQEFSWERLPTAIGLRVNICLNKTPVMEVKPNELTIEEQHEIVALFRALRTARFNHTHPQQQQRDKDNKERFLKLFDFPKPNSDDQETENK